MGGSQADLFDLRSYDASDVPAGYRCIRLHDLTDTLSSVYYAVKIAEKLKRLFP